MINFQAIRVIYKYEMLRAWHTLLQTIASPVISTSLYFVVFGAAIGSRITAIDGVSYGSFIVPGLIMLSLLTQSVSNAAFGIYFPKFTGTIYELLSAPVSYLEIVIGYVGAAATKSIIVGLIILATAGLFVPLEGQLELGKCLAWERTLSNSQLVEQRPEGEKVAAGSGVLTPELLRRHVPRRPGDERSGRSDGLPHDVLRRLPVADAVRRVRDEPR